MAITKGTVLDNNSLTWATVSGSSGDLFILFFYNDGGDDQGTGPDSGELTRIGTGDQGTSMEAGCYYRVITEGEGTNVFADEGDFNSMGNEGYNAHWFLIPAAEWDDTDIPEVADAQSATGTIDPPNLEPSGWAAEESDTIWIICGGRDDDDGLTSVSTNYAANEQLTESTNQVEVGSSYRLLAAAAENPGVFTQTGTAEEYIVFTVAVHGVEGGDTETANIADDEGITDATTWAVGKVKVIPDDVGVSDATTWKVDKIVTIADAMGVTDAQSWIVEKSISIADDMGITDSLSWPVGKVVGVADTVGMTDTVAGVIRRLVSIADGVGITDATARQIDKIIGLAETVGITDDLARIIEKTIGLSDSVGIADLLATIGGGAAPSASVWWRIEEEERQIALRQAEKYDEEEFLLL